MLFKWGIWCICFYLKRKEEKIKFRASQLQEHFYLRYTIKYDYTFIERIWLFPMSDSTNVDFVFFKSEKWESNVNKRRCTCALISYFQNFWNAQHVLPERMSCSSSFLTLYSGPLRLKAPSFFRATLRFAAQLV